MCESWSPGTEWLISGHCKQLTTSLTAKGCGNTHTVVVVISLSVGMRLDPGVTGMVVSTAGVEVVITLGAELRPRADEAIPQL